jgi:hypothetical protein
VFPAKDAYTIGHLNPIASTGLGGVQRAIGIFH